MFRSKRFAVLAFVAALSAAPGLCHADEQGAAAGAVTGAVAGAVIGGPVGAVMGAVVGGVAVGTATGPGALANAEVHEPTPFVEQRGLVQRQAVTRRRGIVQEPETTGTVMETTCIRDARGNTRCRNQVVR